MRSYISAYEGQQHGPLNLPDLVHSISIGGNILEDAICVSRLDEDLGVHLVVNTDSSAAKIEEDVRVEFRGGSTANFFQTKRVFDPEVGKFVIDLISAREPLEINGEPALKAHGLIVNGPKLGFGARQALGVNLDGLQVTLRGFDHTLELFGDRRVKHLPPALTHHFTVESQNRDLSSDTLFKKLGPMASFLGFVKGTRVGFGQIEGEADENATSFNVLGFSKSDGLRAPANWYYPSMLSELPRLFDAYVSVESPGKSRRNFGRALHYYMASNTARQDATEIALLIGMAGLESLAYHVLGDRGGWSADLLKKATLADKLRATARLLAISEDPVSRSAPLKAWIAKASRPDFDGFNVLAEFRNGLTHPVANFSYDGIGLLHAWLASQWLLEVGLLAYLGYCGKYQDRRKIGGWAGELEDMPVNSDD